MTNGDPDLGKSWRKQSDADGRHVESSLTSGQAGERKVNGAFTPNANDIRRGPPSGEFASDTTPVMATLPADEMPPEVEHITAGYQPLSKLVMRLSQETFNDLREVIEALSDMPTSQTPNGHNHYKQITNSATSNGDDETPTNIQKKMRLMNFVQERRAQFIKVLVLAQWSRQSQDVSKVIDLKVWLDKQRLLYDEAGLWLGDLKRSLDPAKMPNPDLRTALEVLSTGKVSWLSDLGYIPPPSLTPQEMLKTLRNINVLLSIRLNLYEHETLPTRFKSFTIASGRVTFHVLNEFEVDLSIADDDPNSQFFFIDLWFLFSPTSAEFPSERLRNEFEGKVNDVLRNEGLKGCYRFLHEFVLTHKINILRRQAVELSRHRWNEAIRLETVRRTLVVQYWLNRAGPKSWIIIGISSGRGQGGRDGGTDQENSTITIRWFADGKEVQHPPIVLRLEHLAMEATMKEVVAAHSNRIFTSIREKLLESKLYAEKTLSLRHTKSDVEPNDCALEIQLTASTTATLVIEPVTGRFALLPASALFHRTEGYLNNMTNPSLHAHKAILELRCAWATDEIEIRARGVGWQPWHHLNPRKEDRDRVFPRDTQRLLFLRRTGWSKDWIVALSSGWSGEHWWIIELMDASVGYNFGDYQRIPVRTSTNHALDPTYDFLSRLVIIAGGMTAIFVNVRALSQGNVNHVLVKNPPSTENAVSFPTLLVKLPALMPHRSSRQSRPWIKEILRVRCLTVSLHSGEATFVAEAKLLHPTPQAELIKGDRVDPDIIFHPQTGAFAFKLVTPVGGSIVDRLRGSLVRIERLISFLAIIDKHRVACDSISLVRLVFIYCAAHSYKADIDFTPDSPMKLTLTAGNPHLRIIDFLTTILRVEGLNSLMYALRATLPLMQIFDELERAPLPDENAQDREFFVLPRSVVWYQLRYTRPQCTLDIRLRPRRDAVKWFIREDLAAAALAPPAGGGGNIEPENTNNGGSGGGGADGMGGASGSGPPIRTVRTAGLAQALEALMSDSGEGWIGLRTGIAADITAVGDVLRRVDGIMRRHVGDHNILAGAGAGATG
ncbi:MAG: mediator complex subunit [Peltula sp. TS41687]|nr:MAG: mediator complex subunit [Peltula sp. TS41687]